MKNKRIGAYCGIDPTAESLHVGHLVPLMALYWLFFEGYEAITLLGGATAKIGDPTGRSTTRPKLERERATANMFKIHLQLKRLWANAENQGRRHGYVFDWSHTRALMNNNAWFNKLPMLEVLRTLGSQMRMGPLLSRDNVRKRLGLDRGDAEGGASEPADGMSFAEFTYPLLQAWDWWELYNRRGVQLQIGGSDQFGNIVTGIQATKLLLRASDVDNKGLAANPDCQVVGLTTPLLTDRHGNKMGKSEGNATWLDPFLTPPFDLYKYFVSRHDDEVEGLLKKLTFLPLPTIAETMAEHVKDPPKRVAQHLLAFEVLALVHGLPVAEATRKSHQALFSGRSASQAPSAASEAGEDADMDAPSPDTRYTATPGKKVTLNNAPPPSIQLPRHLVTNGSLPALLCAAGLVESRKEGHRLMRDGGIYLAANPDRKTVLNWGSIDFVPVRRMFREDLVRYVIGDNLLIIRRGKTLYKLIDIVEDDEWEKSGRTYPGQPFTGRVRMMKQRLKDAGIDLRTVGRSSSTSSEAGDEATPSPQEDEKEHRQADENLEQDAKTRDGEDGELHPVQADEGRLVFPDMPSPSRDRDAFIRQSQAELDKAAAERERQGSN